MLCSCSQGGQLICVALLRARKRGLYHSLRLGAVPLSCPSGHPPSSAHPVYPLSVHESHLALGHEGPSLVPHHTLTPSILCISLAWHSFTSYNFLIPSSHLKSWCSWNNQSISIRITSLLCILRNSFLAFSLYGSIICVTRLSCV